MGAPHDAGPADSAGAEAVYLDALRSHAARVLGMLDREKFSRTYGCLDRTFWAWKFVDFPGARFQEGLCFLSYLYATPYAGSPYADNPRLRAWIAAGFDYWAQIQRPRGDLDEAYPLERSLAATAFSSFYLAEAWKFLEGNLPDTARQSFLRGLEAAADWLCRNDESHGFLSNHLAVAAGALYHAWQITGISRFEVRGQYFIDKILSHQSSEGWYDEYGGADIGYQTHGTFYLARCLELGASEKLGPSLEDSVRFLRHFVHPDGSIGGEYASRNTQTYYPAGFEMRASESAAAAWIAETLRPSVTSLAAAGLGSVDPYNLFPLLNNYVFAHRALARRKHAPTALDGPPDEPEVSHFPAAGLVVVRRPRYRAVISTRKGGVVKVFDPVRRRLVGSDCGWIGRLDGGSVIATQWEEAERPASVDEQHVRTEGSFVKVARPVMDPFRFLAFRIFTLTVGRVPKVAVWVKALLVKVLIYRKQSIPLRFVRQIRLRDDGIEIEDQIEGTSRVERLERGEIFTTIHMGSSRYFVPHELTLPSSGEAESIAPAELVDGATRIRRIAVE